MAKGRDTANFVWKCGNCKRESSAKFEAANPPKPYSDANGNFAPLVTVDCRGLEFTDFQPQVCSFPPKAEQLLTHAQGLWQCVGVETKTPFSEVDLSEGEWTDYDEKVLSVSKPVLSSHPCR